MTTVPRVPLVETPRVSTKAWNSATVGEPASRNWVDMSATM